jgi:hypothetical protein
MLVNSGGISSTVKNELVCDNQQLLLPDFFDKQKIKLMERYDDMGKLPEKYRQMIKSRSNQAIPYGTVILLIFLIWFGLMIRSRNSKNKLAKD